MLKVGFRDRRLRGGKLLGRGRTCSSLLTDAAFCISVTRQWLGPWLTCGVELDTNPQGNMLLEQG